MNELDLVELLKDCPKGTKFYSTVFGDVYFEKIDLTNDYFPIKLTHSDGHLCSVTNKGLLFAEFNGECTLFPSKDQRDWSKWHIPFKDGDVVYANVDDISYILIYHKQEDNTIYRHVCFCLETNTLSYDERIFTKDPVRELRYVSEEEKQLFFDAIKAKGYKWNAGKKELEKIIKEKFDPKTLKPFDKVLGRYRNDGTWKALYFSHLSNGDRYPYHCGSIAYSFCIPYNDDTAHLVGTDEDAPGFYRYWED